MKKFLCLILVLAMSIVGIASASAAGPEDLRPGWYNIGAFTFTNVNTTPVKTVLGTSVSFDILWRPSEEDLGNGFQKLTIQVIDADTGAPLSPRYTSEMGYDDCWYWGITTPEIAVNYGQRIQVWFDVSTLNPAEANGYYCTAYIHSFYSFVK